MPSGSSASPASALPGITLQGGFRFREGQRAFLEKLAAAWARGETNHLGVFVPGYGKTIAALASFVMAEAMGAAEKLVVFVPRGNLRDQYADPEELAETFRALGAPPFSFCVADSDEVFLKNMDTQIVVTTYQYASGDGGHRALKRFCQKAPALFVFDEVHHLAEDGLWAEKVDDIPFARSIGLSGTPLRSDGKALYGVPFTEGEDGEQYYQALHEVTMRDAHAEGGILKRVDAHTVDYDLQMIREDTGEEVALSLSQIREIADENDLDAYLARKRLRFHDVYLEALLTPAFERFAEKRRALSKAKAKQGTYDFRNHQMVVIAMTNRHAAAMLDYIQEHFLDFIATRIGQDVPRGEREERLDAFRQGEIDVMVQVDMIGEGTDIKPLSVIVKADLVRAHSKTMQQVFRGMRYVRTWPEKANRCDLYAADDSGVVHTLNWIVEEEQIGLKKKKEQPPNLNPDVQKEPAERSPWQLKGVARGRMQSRRHEHFDRRSGGRGRDRRNDRRPQVTDVNAREKKLRQECADLANELAYALQADGKNTSIRRVHGEAKKRFHKAQDELSVGELIRKRRWLKKCLRARRLV